MKKRDIEALHRLAKRVLREVEKGNEVKAAKLVLRTAFQVGMRMLEEEL